MNFVPPWVPWPTRRCAVRGCRAERYLETRFRGGRVSTTPRRWCQKHCSVRAAETVKSPATVLIFPRSP